MKIAKGSLPIQVSIIIGNASTMIPAFGHWTLPSSKDALKCTTPVERGLQEAQAVGGK